jgi:hypothetical protein
MTSRERSELEQPLRRQEAERIVQRLFYAENCAVPALAELLLLCDNKQASRAVRRAADSALDLFDAWEDFIPEPPAVRAFKWTVFASDLEERKRALPFLLAHLSRWAA